jgi:hypothetical protein
MSKMCGNQHNVFSWIWLKKHQLKEFWVSDTGVLKWVAWRKISHFDKATGRHIPENNIDSYLLECPNFHFCCF